MFFKFATWKQKQVKPVVSHISTAFNCRISYNCFNIYHYHYLVAIPIKKILGNLIEVKTLCRDTFTNIFSYQVILVFCNIPMLLSLIRPILGHPLSLTITEFIPFRQKHLWDLKLKAVTELLSYIVIVQLLFFLDLDGLF